MKIVILIPVFNELPELRAVLEAALLIRDAYDATILVVDDGSYDGSRELLEEMERLYQGLVALRHPVNCGVGAAWTTGFLWSREQDADVLVTMDADGQHDAQDLKYLLEAVLSGRADVVNGSRFLKESRGVIPFSRKLGNLFANVITFLLSGIWVSDSQSGMKAFNKRAIKKLNFASSGYEVCTEVFREVSWFRLCVREVPISVRYTSYSLAKGQGFSRAFDMALKLVVRSLMR